MVPVEFFRREGGLLVRKRPDVGHSLRHTHIQTLTYAHNHIHTYTPSHVPF